MSQTSLSKFDLSSLNSKIIYDDEHIRVIWSEGSTSYCLISFAPLTSLVNGSRFFADVPVQKLNISCFGVMPKKANWFPIESMIKARNAMHSLIERYHEIVCYGGSMGGYAAIKYSALFKANFVISLCPQWSIDKSECEGINPGFQDFFTPSMKGMAVRPSDVAGKVYILYDPAHPRDSFHANKLMAQCNDVQSVSIHSVAHDVITVMAGTSNLEKIIRFARQKDYLSLNELISNARRAHPIRVREVCSRALIKHPGLLNKILSLSNVSKNIAEDDLAKFNSELLSLFLSRKRYFSAMTVIERLLPMGICMYRKNILKKLKLKLEYLSMPDKNFFITHHGTSVFYDAAKGELVHCHKDTCLDSDFMFPVFVKRYSKIPVIYVTVEGQDHVVQISRKSQVRLGLEFGPDLDINKLIKVEEVDDCFIPVHFGFYLTARKDGSIAYVRKVLKDWEKYKYCSL